MKKKIKISAKSSSSLNKLSLFQKNDNKFSKQCPLSIKNAPIVDYKNIGLLKNMYRIMVKLYPQNYIVSFSKQKTYKRN